MAEEGAQAAAAVEAATGTEAAAPVAEAAPQEQPTATPTEEGKRKREEFESEPAEGDAPPAVLPRTEPAVEPAAEAPATESATPAAEAQAPAATETAAEEGTAPNGEATPAATAAPESAPGMTAAAPIPTTATVSAAPMAGTVEETLECPSGLVGRLIGKGGETISSLQAQCGAHIQIDQETGGPDAPTKKVTITGYPQSVAAGKHLVAELLNAPPGGPPSQGEGANQRVIPCPPGIVGRVIGKGGETIKGLQMQSQAHISIQQDGLGPDEPRPITISGNSQAVEYALQLVENLIQGGSLQSGPILGPSKVLPISPDMIGRVIGRGGETIRGLQQQSGARIQLDQHSESPTVTISGTPQAVEYAASMLQEIFSGGNAASIARGQGNYAVDPSQAYGYGGGYGQYPGYGYGYGQQYGAYQQGYGGAGAAGTWQAAYDPEGRTYYFNTQTGQTQWEKPAGMP